MAFRKSRTGENYWRVKPIKVRPEEAPTFEKEQTLLYGVSIRTVIEEMKQKYGLYR